MRIYRLEIRPKPVLSPASHWNKDGLHSANMGNENPGQGTQNKQHKQKSHGNNVMFMVGQSKAAASHALFLYAPPAVED